MKRLHLVDRPTGLAPWDPWLTACGRKVVDMGGGPSLTSRHSRVTCRSCLRTKLAASWEKAEAFDALASTTKPE